MKRHWVIAWLQLWIVVVLRIAVLSLERDVIAQRPEALRASPSARSAPPIARGAPQTGTSSHFLRTGHCQVALRALVPVPSGI